MNSDERICSIALTLCPGIGHIGAKRLIEGMGSAAEVFSRRKELPEIMPGVNPGVVTALDCPAAFLRAEQEMEFVEKNRLSCLTTKARGATWNPLSPVGCCRFNLPTWNKYPKKLR